MISVMDITNTYEFFWSNTQLFFQIWETPGRCLHIHIPVQDFKHDSCPENGLMMTMGASCSCVACLQKGIHAV